jgi:hypothetical protein
MKNFSQATLSFFSILVLFSSLLLSRSFAQDEEIKKNQWVIIKAPASPAKIIKAKQVEIKELVLIVVDDEDKRSAWQKSMLLHMVEAFSEEGAKRSSEEIQQMVVVYEKLMADVPESKGLLMEEVKKWNAVMEDLKVQEVKKGELEEKNAADKKELLQQATQEVFEDAKEYRLEEVKMVLSKAEQVSRDYPDLEPTLQEYVKPWLQRQKYLEEGRQRRQGEWLTKEEISEMTKKEAEQEEQTYFEEGDKLGFSSLILPQTSVLLVLGLIVLTVLSIIYTFYCLATSREGNLTFSGALMLLLGLGILGVYGYYIFSVLNFTSKLTEYWPEAYAFKESPEQSEKTLARMLYMASGSTKRQIKAEDSKVELQDTQMNVLVREHLKLHSAEEKKFFDVERLQLVVRFHPDRIEFVDEVACAGKQLLIRYEIFYKISDNTFKVDKQKVFLGGAELPSSAGSYLFRRFFTQLQDSLNKTNLNQLYSVENIELGKARFIWPMVVEVPQMAKPKTKSKPAVEEVQTDVDVAQEETVEESETASESMEEPQTIEVAEPVKLEEKVESGKKTEEVVASPDSLDQDTDQETEDEKKVRLVEPKESPSTQP